MYELRFRVEPPPPVVPLSNCAVLKEGSRVAGDTYVLAKQYGVKWHGRSL